MADIVPSEFFRRELKLRSGATFLLTEAGIHAFEAMVSSIHSSAVFERVARFSDVYAACRAVYVDLLSDSLQPDDSDEYLRRTYAAVHRRVHSFAFVVPIFGVELHSIDKFPLGWLRIITPSEDVITSADVRFDSQHLQNAMNRMKPHFWLMGERSGTADYAFDQFRSGADLACAILSVYAASRFRGGATGFRIGTVITAEDGVGVSAGLSWNYDDRELNTRLQYAKSQPLKLDEALLQDFQDTRALQRATQLLEKESLSQLE